MAIRETLSTLQFADRAKRIKNKAVVNEEANYQKKYLELMKEVEQLRKGQGPQ
jgi:kinesin family protein 1